MIPWPRRRVALAAPSLASEPHHDDAGRMKSSTGTSGPSLILRWQRDSLLGVKRNHFGVYVNGQARLKAHTPTELQKSARE